MAAELQGVEDAEKRTGHGERVLGEMLDRDLTPIVAVEGRVVVGLFPSTLELESDHSNLDQVRPSLGPSNLLQL